MHAQQMIATHPHLHGRINEALIRCIEDCYDCAQTCTACADACLGEERVREMVQCVRTCLDCADVCGATGEVASRRTGSNVELIARMLQTCEAACAICARECERHATAMPHCRICGEACRRCERACREAAGALQPTLQ
jgi:hypothetical protein